ncbi:MAG: TIR domain-containing protein [Verrucomicrobia bacterium]|nr:TIR domain-containing protein [Verrucomicrobiota bacterium]
MSRIFISYRRSDSQDVAGRIYDRLVATFGADRLFKDVDAIPVGADFRKHLTAAVEQCDVMLAIVGARWVDAHSETGARRLDCPDDVVRIEIEAALARDIPVVPVLIGHATMPTEAQLPASLGPFAFRQAIPVRSDPDFHRDMDRLIEALQRLVSSPLAKSAPPRGPAFRSATSAQPASGRLDRGTVSHARTKWWAAAAGLVVAAALMVMSGLVDLARFVPGRQNDPGIRSLAVLPLKNLTNDPEQEYFSDGMTEALIADLARVGGLRVISRTSAMTYKSSPKGLPEIARDLNVDVVLEGSLARSGNRVRVTTQLIDGKTNLNLWANSYERDLRDVLSLQDELARAIAQEIKVTLTPQEAARFAAARAVNPAAHEAYLRGRFVLGKGTEETINKAIAYFNQAIEQDAAYAPPYAGLADAYSALRMAYVRPHDVMPRAKTAATKAVQLDPALAEAQLSLANVLMTYEFDWRGAEKALKRAIDLSPNLGDAHHVYALYLAGLGRHDEARFEIERAMTLDPLSLQTLNDAGWVYYLARRYDRTIELNQKAIDLDANFWPAHAGLGLGYEKVGRFTDAEASLLKARQLDNNPTVLEMLGGTYAAWGKKDEARKVLADLSTMVGQHYVCPYEVATVHAGLGDKEATLQWLEKGYRERADCMAWTGSDPKFDELRGDPRFENLVRRMGIAR